MPAKTIGDLNSQLGFDIMEAQTKTPKTLEHYKQVATRLLENRSGDLRADEGVDEWIRREGQRWSKPTFRLYRAALVAHFESMEHRDLELADRIRAVSQPLLLVKPPKRGAAKKMKGGARGMLEELVTSMARRAQDLSDDRITHACAWMAATLYTGLRPIEWRDAVLIRGRGSNPTRLVVKNAKATNGRANGSHRTILLSLASKDQVLAIEVNLDLRDRWMQVEARDGEPLEDRFNRLHKAISYLIAREARVLWPRRDRVPCLYTARHQFAADAKSALPLPEVAALMGHASDMTATNHYARRVSGSKDRSIARPLESEVATVRHISEVRFARRRGLQDQSETPGQRSPE